MSEDDDNTPDLTVVQRRVPAAAGGVKTDAPRSVFDWRPKGPDLPTTPEPESTTVPKKSPQPAATGSTQKLLCLALLDGSMSRQTPSDSLASLDAKQLGNAIYNAQKQGRVTTNGDQIQITKAGRAWLKGEGVETPPRAAKVPRAKSTRKTRELVVAPPAKPRPAPPVGGDAWPLLITDVSAKPFRCAQFSDGSFQLEKDGSRILLTPEETATMRAYQERMQ